MTERVVTNREVRVERPPVHMDPNEPLFAASLVGWQFYENEDGSRGYSVTNEAVLFSAISLAEAQAYAEMLFTQRIPDAEHRSIAITSLPLNARIAFVDWPE